MASLQLSPMNTTRCDFENSERDRWVLDGTDKCGTVYHGMSKSLLLIVSTEIMKIKIYWVQRDSKGIGIGVMQGGIYTLGLHEI